MKKSTSEEIAKLESLLKKVCGAVPNYFRSARGLSTTPSDEKAVEIIQKEMAITSSVDDVPILVTYGLNFYSTTIKTTNKLIDELNKDPLPEITCAQKVSPEQDLCYLILSIMRQSKDPRICDNIVSDFYKMTCYRSLQ